MLIACSLFFLRSIWPWITCLVFLAFTAFLWILGPSGYKFASLIPLLVIILIISICYLKNPIKRLIILAVSIFSLILSIIEIPIVLSSKNDAKPEMKYIIVLGAAVYGKEPSISLRNRMDAAAARMAMRVITPTEKRVCVVLVMEKPSSNKRAPQSNFSVCFKGRRALKARRRIFNSVPFFSHPDFTVGSGI